MKSGSSSLLILGLGNTLLSDDGLGVRAIERLHELYEIPVGARALDGGTLGLSLLTYFEHADRAILVDAIQTDNPPGSLVRLEGEDVAPAARERLSVHQVGVADLLDGLHLLGEYPEQIMLIGLVPASLELATELSPPVEANLDLLVEHVAAEAAAQGFPFRTRDSSEVVVAEPHRARALGAGL